MLTSLAVRLTHQLEVIAPAARTVKKNVCPFLHSSISGSSVQCNRASKGPGTAAQAVTRSSSGTSICPDMSALPGGSLKEWSETCPWWPTKWQNSVRKVFESWTLKLCYLFGSAANVGHLHHLFTYTKLEPQLPLKTAALWPQNNIMLTWGHVNHVLWDNNVWTK